LATIIAETVSSTALFFVVGKRTTGTTNRGLGTRIGRLGILGLRTRVRFARGGLGLTFRRFTGRRGLGMRGLGFFIALALL
jgi:hypothetical protein